MSRITGNDARGLVEAYQAVYAPQELTEEQVWEEVETWVNSLLEEGYDLSDYTWEEMYENYLSELNMDKYSGPPEKPKQIVRRPMASMGPNYADQETKLSQAANRSQIGTPRQGSAGGNSGLGNISPSEGTGRGGPSDIRKTQPRTNIPPTKPAAATPAKPAAATPSAKPAMGPTGKPLVGGIERRTPTRAEMGAAKAYRTPAATTGTLGAATAAATAKPNAFGSSTPAAAPTPAPAAAPAPKPTPAATGSKATGSKKPGSVFSHFDPFDVIKGHLLDEGYADTEESALAIMANMSEEWREDIIDEAIDIQEKLKKGTKGRISFTTGKDSNYDQAMTEKNPKTGRQRGTSPELKAMGAHGRARSKQAAAERSGDTEAARRNEKRRGKLAHIVYNKTGRIIDRADND